MSDSTTPGYLVQTFPPHVADKLDQNFVLDQSMLTLANSLDDDDLFDFFHDFIVGLTGLANEVVLPRWQPEAPNIPDTVPNWCGFGITSYKADVFAADVMKANGSYELHRHETVELLASFYGPNAGAYARILRDGMQVEQNLDALRTNYIGLVESGEVLMVPSLFKEIWLRRADLQFTVKRQIVRGFPVVSITSFNGTVNNEKYTESIKA